MNALAPHFKAIVGAVVAGLSVIVAADTIDQRAWLSGVIAGLVALGAIWATPNKPAPVK